MCVLYLKSLALKCGTYTAYNISKGKQVLKNSFAQCKGKRGFVSTTKIYEGFWKTLLYILYIINIYTLLIIQDANENN